VAAELSCPQTVSSVLASIVSTTPKAWRSASSRGDLLDRFPEYAVASSSYSSRRRAEPSFLATRAERQRPKPWATRINTKFGQGSNRPIALLRAHHEAAAVFRYYEQRMSATCRASTTAEFVAKEFVAARDDETRSAGPEPVHGRRQGAHRGLRSTPTTSRSQLGPGDGAQDAGARQQDRLRAMRSYIAESTSIAERGGCSSMPPPATQDDDRPAHRPFRGGAWLHLMKYILARSNSDI